MGKELFERFQSAGDKKQEPDASHKPSAAEVPAHSPAPATEPSAGPVQAGQSPVVTLGPTGVVVALALFALFGLAGFFLGRETGKRGAPVSVPPPPAQTAAQQYVIRAAAFASENRKAIDSAMRVLQTHHYADPAAKPFEQKSGNQVVICIGPYNQVARNNRVVDTDLAFIKTIEQPRGNRPFADAAIEPLKGE